MGFTFSLLWVVKFGRASVTATRWRDIQADLSREIGRNVKCYVIHLPVLYAQKMENMIAWIYGKCKYDGLQKCTGRTEFYQFPNLICATVAAIWLYLLGRVDWLDKALILLVVPVPIDAALLVVGIALLQYLILGGVFGGLIWFILT